MQLLNLTKKTRDKKEYRHAVQFIFCKFLVGNSEITEAYELRNIDITESTFRFFECKFKISHIKIP